MMITQAQQESTSANPAGNPRTIGWILIVSAILAVGFAMIHPQLTAHELTAVLRQMEAGAVFNGWVHGILMALYVVLVSGYLGFSRHLGLHKPLISLAMLAYGFGAVAMMGAAVINGFALGLFAERYTHIRPDQLNAVAASINAMGSISGTWAGVGAVASSMAILLWSVELLQLRGAWRATGAIGIGIGAITSIMLMSGTLILDVHGFLLLVLSQSIWTIAIGFQLLRGMLGRGNP